MNKQEREAFGMVVDFLRREYYNSTLEVPKDDSFEKVGKDMIKSWKDNTVALPLSDFIERLKKLDEK